MKTKNVKRKPNIFLWLALIFVSVLAVSFTVSAIVYAAYTNSKNTQRTIATYDTAGERFSSNYLKKGNIGVTTLFVDSGDKPSTTITVCNYEQGKLSKPSTSAISYRITFSFVKYDSTEKVYVDATAGEVGAYSVKVTNGGGEATINSSNLSHTFSDKEFAAGESHSDAYFIEMSANFATTLPKPNLFLSIVVTPTGTGVSELAGLFNADLRAQEAVTNWRGYFDDDTSDKTPADYDGFNYVITGSGSGTFTLSWNGEKVALSEVSKIDLLKIDGAEMNGNSISFSVDSTIASRYAIQFYKVNITSENWAQMSGVGGVVTFTFIADD